MINMQMGQEDMLDSFLFFQRETGSQGPGIYHEFVIDEESYTAANMRTIESIDEQIRSMSSEYANFQTVFLCEGKIFIRFRIPYESM